MTSAKLRILNNASPVSLDLPDPRPQGFSGRVALITLGCAKNQVDSEVMIGALASRGFECVEDVSEADIAIVNTCGFLESAVEEGIDTIIDVAELKSQRLKKLIVAGCMVERYGEQLPDQLPEVDHFLTTNDLLDVVRSAEGEFESVLDQGARPYFLYDDTMPRYLSRDTVSAYVKISEGCNRPCSFCIIPSIRGKLRSRTSESIVSEMNQLADEGIREANLVAQDLTDFGADRKEKDGFLHLLDDIGENAKIPWVRLFYAYPLGISERVLKAIVRNPRVVNYLDIPLQHVSDELLGVMKRPRGKYSPRALAEQIRTVTPEIALRTTFIVGHPGETDEHIAELEQFLRDIRFEHVGIFEYSPEIGTPSAELENQVEDEEKKRRREYLMGIQQELATEKLSSYVGKTEMTLIEGLHPDSDSLIQARAAWQGPEVDGVIIVNDFQSAIMDSELSLSALRGQFATVRYTELAGYDLVGTIEEVLGNNVHQH